MTPKPPEKPTATQDRKRVVIRCQRESVGEALVKGLRKRRLWRGWWLWWWPL